ncbi:MAG: Minf_1886 family protein [Phycisphaerae bacterium]
MPEEPQEPTVSMEEVIRRDGRYPLEAFGLLQEALSRAVQRHHGRAPNDAGSRHVSGSQLCLSLRDLACERWGMLARTVLHRWNIHSTRDIGEMVFLLVEHGFMRKTPQDRIEDFDDVFDFGHAFEEQYTFETDK